MFTFVMMLCIYDNYSKFRYTIYDIISNILVFTTIILGISKLFDKLINYLKVLCTKKKKVVPEPVTSFQRQTNIMKKS